MLVVKDRVVVESFGADGLRRAGFEGNDDRHALEEKGRLLII